MPTFTDRIAVVIDVVSDKASASLTTFRSNIREAQGVAGKLKAGWAGAVDSIKANAGALAATAGTALVAFGVKAVGAFTDAAKAALDLAKATGLSTEQASRWIAVGDDFGVTAEQLSTGLGRIAKDLDAAKWQKYGIATRDAAGNARDANAILLDALDVLGGIDNETERARVGAELFGKSFANIAPMVGATRKEYEDMLSTVEGGQVITEAEAKRAEKMRLAQDKLNDALEEFTLAVGGAAASLAPLVEGIAEVVIVAEKLGAIDALVAPPFVATSSAADELGGQLRDLAAAAEASGDAIAYLVRHGWTETAAIGLMREYAAETAEAKAASKGLGDETLDAADALDTMRDVVEETTEATSDLAAELQGLADDNAALDLADQFDGLREAAEEAWTKTAAGADDAGQAQRDYQREINDTKIATAQYLTEVLKLPEERVTEILALIDAGSLEEAQRLIDNAARPRVATISTKFGGDAGSSAKPKPATSGPMVLEGLEGPSRSAATLNVSVNVNGVITGSQVGREIADALTRWFADGGTAGWVG